METHNNCALKFNNVSKTFESKDGEVKALENVTLSVKENEIITIVGPSGCGKSTLLRIACGLIESSIGETYIFDKLVEGVQGNVGMNFQTPTLLQWRSVLQNVMLPIEIKRLDYKEHKSYAMDLIELTGLSGFENKFPHELSGGMQQRVALCRTLMIDPVLMLMDEPFAALDALTRDKMSLELLRIWEEKPKTILFVTHSITEAIFLADRIVVMSCRPGCISKIFEVPIPRPRTLETKRDERFSELYVDVHKLL